MCAGPPLVVPVCPPLVPLDTGAVVAVGGGGIGVAVGAASPHAATTNSSRVKIPQVKRFNSISFIGVYKRYEVRGTRDEV
jgi:hypothetical protein